MNEHSNETPNAAQDEGARLHPPAMVAEVLECLSSPTWAAEPQSSPVQVLERPLHVPQDALLIDGTLGTAGHTLAMLRSHPTARVAAFDRDASSIEVARARLKQEGLEDRVEIVRGDFRNAPMLLESYLEKQASRSGRAGVDGALVDAGMSMWQVADAAHGLSFWREAPLDMRYDRSQSWSAFDVVNRALPSDLEDVLFSYTDERWARRIVEFVVAARQRKAIASTLELAELVEAAIPVGARRGSKVHAATKTFAALRLAVNTEYWALDQGVRALCSLLNPGARLVLLTYSSHEDRIVKHLFRRLSSRPVAEPAGMPMAFGSERKGRKNRPPVLSAKAARETLPFGLEPLEEEILQMLKLPDEAAREDEAEAALVQSGWGQSWIGHIVTRKPIEPGREEVESNALSRSCKLRAIEKRMLNPDASA